MSVSLRSLSDSQVLSRIQRLTQSERSLTLAVLLHLNEIERRRLHLQLGHSSMFDYCTIGLGYSGSAASRRIRTARCIARFPEVYELLRLNQVNVSTVSQVSKILTPENKDGVLARICGKSQREVEAVIAEYEPLASLPRDRVRTVVVRVKAPMPPVGKCVSTRENAGGGASTQPDMTAGTVSPEPPEGAVNDHNRNDGMDSSRDICGIIVPSRFLDMDPRRSPR